MDNSKHTFLIAHINNMTVPQLKEFAAANSIDIGKLTRKQDIIDAIIATAKETAPTEPATDSISETEATEETPANDEAENETKETAPTEPAADPAAKVDETETTEETPGADDGGEKEETPQQTDPAKEKPPDEGDFIIGRILKVTKPLIRGEDVQAVQTALIKQGLHCGIDGASGVYNANTAVAVRHFQSKNRLIVDGKVGKFTAAALGAKWTYEM